MKYVIKDYAEIKKRVENMGADELLRCVICPDFPPEKRTPVKNTVALMLHPTTVETAKNAIREVNRGRADRALVAVDMEYGAGKALKGATRFPSMRAAAEARDEKLAYQMGVIAAKEAIDAGYTWTFGPCVDLLINHRNPIVSIRSPGEDAQTVIRFGGAYLADFPKIEAKMQELVQRKEALVRKEISKTDVMELFASKGQTYKNELIAELEDGKITTYTQG